MFGWALTIYYFILYMIPFGNLAGYQWLYQNNVFHLSGPVWWKFGATVSTVFILLCGAGYILEQMLLMDDKRWKQVIGSVSSTGWLGPVDFLIPFVMIAAVIYAVIEHVPLYGLVAAIIPAILAPIFTAIVYKTSKVVSKARSKQTSKEMSDGESVQASPALAPNDDSSSSSSTTSPAVTGGEGDIAGNDPDKVDEGGAVTNGIAGQSEPEKTKYWEDLDFGRLTKLANEHLARNDFRDTIVKRIVFFPPLMEGGTMSRSERAVQISWVIDKKTQLADAYRKLPKVPFETGGLTQLRDAILTGSRDRVVRNVAELVVDKHSCPAEQDRLWRILTFVNEAIASDLAPINSNQADRRTRLPLVVLAECRASQAERIVLMASMILAIGMPIAVWLHGNRIGLALDGLTDFEWDETTEYFDDDNNRLLLLDCDKTPQYVIRLSRLTKLQLDQKYHS